MIGWFSGRQTELQEVFTKDFKLKVAGCLAGQKWRWGGCRSSSMESGVRVSRILFDSATEGTDARAAVSLHNFQAGREVS